MPHTQDHNRIRVRIHSIPDDVGTDTHQFALKRAVFCVSKNAKRYISKGINDEMLRFLVVDPVTQRMLETSLTDELGRIARTMTRR
jgi:hypothetical protein